MKWILETQRLRLRELTWEDLEDLREILQDPVTMSAYEHAFDDEEVHRWLSRQLERYATEGYGLWAVILKESGQLVGQLSLTRQKVPQGEELEIGYLFKRRHWHKGYATEAAIACREYAFDKLGAKKVTSIIRDTNLASQRVAQRNGMVRESTFVKHYHGVDMPHWVYAVYRKEN